MTTNNTLDKQVYQTGELAHQKIDLQLTMTRTRDLEDLVIKSALLNPLKRKLSPECHMYIHQKLSIN